MRAWELALTHLLMPISHHGTVVFTPNTGSLELLFTGPAEQHPSVHARAAQNELKLGQDFTLSSSRPSQLIPVQLSWSFIV